MLSFFLKKQKADYTEHLIKGPILYPAARMAENPKLSTGKARRWERRSLGRIQGRLGRCVHYT